MARYIVNNSRFRPLEFQEMLAPVLAAEEAHVNIENQFGELREKANVWESMANKESDPEAYRMYKSYSDDLRAQAEQLNAEGLTPRTRASLLNMRERFSSEILPIEAAYQTRDAQIKAQLALSEKDPSFRHSRSASLTSLDDYIKDPTIGYLSISGNLLAALVSQLAQALAKEIRDNPTEFRSILGGQMYEAISKRGFSSEEVAAAMRGDLNANPLLTDLVENAMLASGAMDFDPQSRALLALSASQGLLSAVGEDKSQLINNNEWQMNYASMLRRQEADHSLANQIALMDIQAAREREALREREANAPAGPGKRPAWKPIPIVSTDKSVVKDFGGEAFKEVKDIVSDVFQTNKENFTDAEILERRNDPKRTSLIPGRSESLDSSFVAPVGFIRRGNTSTVAEGRTERTQKIDAIIDVMESIGVDNLEDLLIGIQQVEHMAGRMDNVYALDLTSVDLAVENLGRWIDGASTYEGLPLREVNSRGALGKSISREDASKMIKDNQFKNIAYDTTIDEMVLLHEGKKYAIQPELIHPEYRDLIKELKYWNPKSVSRVDEKGDIKPFAEYFDEVMFVSENYEYRLKNKEGSFLDTFQETLNNLPKVQGTSGQDKVED